MTRICYHASHEQFPPSMLLQYAKAAERAGFDGIHSSDHFHPWSTRQGNSGFSLSWIAAALQATSLPFSIICAPGQRYHPAILAQALATLAEMFPNRIDMALGSGEAINECITGEPWPDKATRNERLKQCSHLIKRLLNGETVTFDGLVKVRNARLFTLPGQKPLLLCAALSEETAAWAAPWADGLLTVADQDVAQTRRTIDAFRSAGGHGKPVHLKFGFSYAHSRQQAIDEACEQWHSHFAASPDELADFATVENFDAAACDVSQEEVLARFPVYTDMNALRSKLQELAATGAEQIVLHNLNMQHEAFIEDFGKSA